ncbi:MAG: hypothetical protein QGF53_10145 [Alphaproteobacteria bacterium]|nr:hypothetical protein [Alphaproteobacteria bacterium]
MTRKDYARTLTGAALLLLLAGCNDRDVTSSENGLWKMFAGHPKPIILDAPPPPVYCVRTLGGAECYGEPVADDRAAAIR